MRGLNYSDKTKCPTCAGVGERTSGNKCITCGGTGRVGAKDVRPVGDLQPTVLKLAERKPRPRSLSILEPKDMEKMTGVPGGKMTFAEKMAKDVRPVGDELWTPNHKNPVPTGWLRLSKEAMRLAGEAQLAAAKYDKNWDANKAMFSALRRLNAAQNTGDEAKLRKEAATVMSEVGAKAKDVRPVGDMDGGSDYEIAQRILKLAKAGQSAEKIVKKLKGDEHDLRFVRRVMQGAYGANAEKLKYED